jgi:hypothetical protein
MRVFGQRFVPTRNSGCVAVIHSSTRSMSYRASATIASASVSVAAPARS